MITNKKLNWLQTGEDNEFTKSVKDFIDSQPIINGQKDMSGFDGFMKTLGAIKIKDPINQNTDNQ